LLGNPKTSWWSQYRRLEFRGNQRNTPEGRDPLKGFASGARWDPGSFDVLYTSLDRDGALAERYFHLSRQPVFPSKPRNILHRIRVRTQGTLCLPDMKDLEKLGVDLNRFGELVYARTQTIADAAYFLGFDALQVPSARRARINLVLFTDRFEPADLELEASEPVDWGLWKR
jgi:hypothetical protein